MNNLERLNNYVSAHPEEISQVIGFDPSVDKFYHFDFTAANSRLSEIDFGDPRSFNGYIDSTLKQNDCRFGIGGYMEHRAIYQRSALFDTEEEPRRLHLGVDIWGSAGTAIYAPLDGIVHSFADNNRFGDYGPTLILEHNPDGLTLFSLYGHLSRQSLIGLYAGKILRSGQKIAELGEWAENGSWPPHLHFQLMFNMQGMIGDYPGVGKLSEMTELQKNIPDPDILLRIA